eukprot:gene1762-33176_t
MDSDGPSTSTLDLDDDPIVRELDVYVCNEFMGSSTHLCLLQSPLRPPWRPYPYETVSGVRIKSHSKKLEMDVPLDVESRNYNDIIEDFKKVNQVTLRSSLVESKASLALGTIQEGKLLLSPIDYSVHLRPGLEHLNVGKDVKRGTGGKEESDDSGDEPEMRAVEVQVQKRETERQQQARLNSYAYISQKEEEEAWVPMKLHTSESVASETIWQRFMSPKEQHTINEQHTIDVNMERSEYLDAFIPCASTGPGGGEGEASEAPPVAPPPGELVPEVKLEEEVVAILNGSLRALFAKHSVCNLENVKTEVVLEVVADKESFKRAEVTELATSRKINVTETMYNRVVKDMCQSKGLQWQLKGGADF